MVYTVPQLQEAIKEKNKNKEEVKCECLKYEEWKFGKRQHYKWQHRLLHYNYRCRVSVHSIRVFFALKNITKPKISAIHPHNFSHLFFISVSEVACP